MHVKESEQSIKGMTVNERLYHFKLFPAFDAAVRARDERRIVAVLTQARFTQEQATETTQMLLATPEKYGF